MCPRLDNLTLVEHYQLIKFSDRRQSMRDGDDGLAFHQIKQVLLDCRFHLGVEGRRRFVQNQDGSLTAGKVLSLVMTIQRKLLSLQTMQYVLFS